MEDKNVFGEKEGKTRPINVISIQQSIPSSITERKVKDNITSEWKKTHTEETQYQNKNRSQETIITCKSESKTSQDAWRSRRRGSQWEEGAEGARRETLPLLQAQGVSPAPYARRRHREAESTEVNVLQPRHQ